MKLYTLTYDDARPTKQQLNIPTNSDYKIGIKVIGSKDAGKIDKINTVAGTYDISILAEDFNLYPQQVTLVGDDGSTIQADPELTNGYVTFTLRAGDEANFAKYKVQVKNDTFDGIQYSPVKQGTTAHGRVQQIDTIISCDTPTTIYPSDKFQYVDKDGKIYPNYSNETPFYFRVKNSAGQILDDSTYRIYPYHVVEISPKDGIRYGVRRNNYALNNSGTEVGHDLAAKYTDEMIAAGDTLELWLRRACKGAYYVQFAVIPYENTFDLAVNIFKSQQGDIELQAPEGTATQEWVEDYVSGELEDYATTEYVDNAVSGKVSGSSVGQAPAILSATSVYASDWATLSSTADENTMYVVLPDPVTP